MDGNPQKETSREHLEKVYEKYFQHAIPEVPSEIRSALAKDMVLMAEDWGNADPSDRSAVLQKWRTTIEDKYDLSHE